RGAGLRPALGGAAAAGLSTLVAGAGGAADLVDAHPLAPLPRAGTGAGADPGVSVGPARPAADLRPGGLLAAAAGGGVEAVRGAGGGTRAGGRAVAGAAHLQ